MPDIHSISYREITYRDSRDLTDFIDRLQNPKNAPLYPQKRLLHHLYLMDSFCGCSLCQRRLCRSKTHWTDPGPLPGTADCPIYMQRHKKSCLSCVFLPAAWAGAITMPTVFLTELTAGFCQTCPESFQGELIFYGRRSPVPSPGRGSVPPPSSLAASTPICCPWVSDRSASLQTTPARVSFYDRQAL